MIESLKHKAARLAKKKAKYEEKAGQLGGNAAASKKLAKVSGKLDQVTAKREARQAKNTTVTADV